MSPLHLLNLAIHIGAGAAAIALGLYMLGAAQGTARHRQLGRVFGWLGLVVGASAVVGLVLFRFLPLFAVLSVLIAFQLLSGWHVIYTKAAGPNGVDALMLAVAAGTGLLLAPHALSATVATGGAPVAVYSSLGALVSVLLYEALRWVVPRAWHGVLWRYEHIYKLLASLFGMISAAVGNTVRVGQPWSQVLPSALGLVVIVFFCVRNYRAQGARARVAGAVDLAAAGGPAA